MTSLGPRQDAASPFTEVFATSARPLDAWPDFESYPGPSAALDVALMREVDLSAVPLNALQQSIMNAIVELYGTDLAAMGMRLADAKDAQALLDRVKTLRYPTR